MSGAVPGKFCDPLCRFVYTVSDLGVPVMFPSSEFIRRRLLPSTGSHRVGSPGFVGTVRRSDFLTVLLAALRFLRLAIPWLRPAFRPRSAADAWPTDHPGVCCQPVAPGPVFFEGDRQDLPSSRGTLMIIRPVLRPRRDRTGSAGPRVSLPDAAPAGDQGKGSTQRNFGAQSHGV